MKTGSKILVIVLAVMVLMSTTVMAMPNDTIVIGQKAFSLDALMNGFGDVQGALNTNHGNPIFYSLDGVTDDFKNLLTGDAMTQEQKDALNNIAYMQADGSVVTLPKFNDDVELTVVGTPTAISLTTARVRFSDGTTQELPLSNALVSGVKATRTVTYNDKSFELKDLVYTVPTPATISVEGIQLINYREMKVTFNSIVDEKSAENPANYYFAIVEGNGAQGFAANNKLHEALSFEELNDKVSGVVLDATVDNGKTVVTIHFPEDGRFTYRLDPTKHRSDDERVIIIEKANGEKVALDEGETVDIAVRNITVNGQYKVNTYVQKIEIKDLVNPNLIGATKYMTNNKRVISPVDVAVPFGQAIEIENSKVNDDCEGFTVLRRDDFEANNTSILTLKFDEPVFDGHLNDWSELENPEILSDVRIYINDTEVAKTSDHHDFDNIAKFYMDDEDLYSASCNVELNLYNAVEEYIEKIHGDMQNFWNVNKTYNVKVIGITDLAGNILKSSTINFDIKLINPPTWDTTVSYYAPQVIKAVQVADNVIRVYFDQAVTDFTFVMQGSDGDSGNITKYFNSDAPLTGLGKNGNLYYYDVYLPASDFDFNNGSEPILSYKNQAFVNDTVTIKDIKNDLNLDPSDDGAAEDFAVTLVKDINAPIGDTAGIEGDPKYYEDISKDSIIKVTVKDVTPFAENIGPNEVYGVRYHFGFDEFTDNVDLAHGDYLPITISYDNHQQVISNKPNLVHNPGIPGAITYNQATRTLSIDLNRDSDGEFANLLNDDGKLVEGKTYTISIPRGYFSDSKRLDAYLGDYNPNDPDKLYVDDGRGIWCKDLGFASEPITLTFTVPNKRPVNPDEYKGVPQTTKELIKWDEVRKAVVVEFTGDIAEATLVDPNSYTLDGVALPANTSIVYEIDNQGTLNNLQDDQKFAIITLPKDTVAVDGFVDFEVRNVANPAGGKMTPVITKIMLEDNTRPVIKSAVTSGANEVVITFSEPLQYKPGENSGTASKNFIVKVNGAPSDVSDAVINSTDKTKVTLSVNGTVFDKDDVITVLVQEDVGSAINIVDKAKNMNPIKVGEYTVTNTTN